MHDAESAAASAGDAAHHLFLSRLDHELKNPLTAIRAALAVLAQEADPSSSALQTVDSQTRRLGGLIEDLRKLSNLERTTIAMERIELPALVEDVVEAIIEEADAANLPRIDKRFPTTPWPLPPVHGDPELLFVAVHNLVHNAVKFFGTDHVVIITGTETTDHVTIEVSDGGRGIPPSDLDTVWQELARGSNVDHTPGNGIGLALVATIIQRHGGTVSLESKLGLGTRARITLPLHRIS